MFWWIVYKTGTKTNPVIVTTPTSGTEFTSLSQGNPTVIGGVSYTVTTAGGPYSSQAAAQAGLSRITAAVGAPPASTAVTSGWIIVPEGSLGEVTNALSVIGNTVNPEQLTNVGSLSGTLQAALSELGRAGAIGADATGNGQTTYTVKQLTSAGQVVAAQNSGLTVYPTQAAAQQAASQQNVAGTSSQSITQLLGNLESSNLWIRVAKAVVGGALIIIGISHMTGASNAVATFARKAPLPI